MTENELCTYDDWWEGSICLWYSITSCKVDEAANVKKVTWDKFHEGEISKIKTKQKELYECQLYEYIEKLKKSFSQEYQNSRLKVMLLNDEIKQCREIIIGRYPKDEIVRIKGHRNLIFFDRNRQKIEEYVDRYLKKGEALSYDFIHSPNYIYQKKDDIPIQIYAESIWLYLDWLLQFQAEKNNTPNKDEAKTADVQLPANPYPTIFNSWQASEMFLTLKNNTVNKGSEISDFAAIYYFMTDPSLMCIKADITHREFIEFLNQKLGYEIYEIKFKRRKQHQYHKQAAFENAKERYQK